MPDVADHGYPVDKRDILVEVAEEEFADRLAEHGSGKNWMNDEPRDHIFKAVDELMQTRNHAHEGDLDEARTHAGNAFNHMLFMMEIMYRELGSEHAR